LCVFFFFLGGGGGGGGGGMGCFSAIEEAVLVSEFGSIVLSGLEELMVEYTVITIFRLQ